MAEVQTVYNDFPANGFAGMIANGETGNRISRTAESAMAFGVPVYRGTGDHGCTDVVGTAATFLGISIAHEALQPLAGETADNYQVNDNVAILTKGVIWVTAGEAVTDGAQAYADATTGAIVDTSTSNILLTGWVFDQTAASGAIVRLARR